MYSLGYLPSKKRWYVFYRSSGLTPSINDIMKDTSKNGYSSHDDAYYAAERTGNTFISEYEITCLREFEIGQVVKLAQDIETDGSAKLMGDLTPLDTFTIHLFSGMEFQIASLDKEHNMLYAGAIKEKGVLITAPIYSDSTIFEIPPSVKC